MMFDKYGQPNLDGEYELPPPRGKDALKLGLCALGLLGILMGSQYYQLKIIKEYQENTKNQMPTLETNYWSASRQIPREIK